jgi:hypothetical protein
VLDSKARVWKYSIVSGRDELKLAITKDGWFLSTYNL